MLILGVDPGLSGALVTVTLAGELVSVIDMPTLKPGKRRVIDEIELARLIDAEAKAKIEHAFVERVGVRPGESPVAAFSFGHGVGVLIGILRAHFIPVTLVTPQTWKRAHGIPAGSGKDASRAKAKALWQRDAGRFVRVKDEGRAEAALLAAHGQRHILDTMTRRAAA